MIIEEPNMTFRKRTKSMSDILGYLAAGAYSGSALLYFLFDYHLAACVYLLMTVYFVGMSSLLILQMATIESASFEIKTALHAAIPEALKVDFSFCFYHGLLIVGLLLPFIMPNASSLTQAFAIIVGLLEVIMLATAKTLNNKQKKEQP